MSALQIFEETLNIQFVPTNKTREAGESCAARIVERLVADRGMDHAMVVMRCIAETSPENRRHLTRPVITAVSDVLLAHPRWANDGLAILEAMDRVDLDAIWKSVKRAKVSPRGAIAAPVYIELERILGPSVLPKPKKVKQPKPEPKRKPMNESHIALGLSLLELRSEISHNVRFASELRRRFDVDQKLASQAMAAARCYAGRPEVYNRVS
jgi:hypothetical protein